MYFHSFPRIGVYGSLRTLYAFEIFSIWSHANHIESSVLLNRTMLAFQVRFAAPLIISLYFFNILKSFRMVNWLICLFQFSFLCVIIFPIFNHTLKILTQCLKAVSFSSRNSKLTDLPDVFQSFHSKIYSYEQLKFIIFS